MTISILDRLVASSSGMAGTLYVLAACVLWWVLIVKKNGRPGSVLNSRNVIVDRAVAWSALAVLFLALAAGKLRLVDWRSLGWIFLVTTLAVMIAGLFSVREITRARFGRHALYLFIVAVAAAGISIWLWG